MIVVASYWLAREIAEDLDPGIIVSIMDPEDANAFLPGVRTREHLRLCIHDIVDGGPPAPGFIAPRLDHVQVIVDLARCWSGKGNLLFHCRAGLSRSTAAAIVFLSARYPGREAAVVRHLAQRGPWARPNRRLIEIADQLLTGDGSLLTAWSRVSWGGSENLLRPIILRNSLD